MTENRAVPNPRIPENTIILRGTDALGREVVVARGFCECNATRERSKEFYIGSPGESWTCAECGRTYMLDPDGEGISATDASGNAV